MYLSGEAVEETKNRANRGWFTGSGHWRLQALPRPTSCTWTHRGDYSWQPTSLSSFKAAPSSFSHHARSLENVIKSCQWRLWRGTFCSSASINWTAKRTSGLCRGFYLLIWLKIHRKGPTSTDRRPSDWWVRPWEWEYVSDVFTDCSAAPKWPKTWLLPLWLLVFWVFLPLILKLSSQQETDDQLITSQWPHLIVHH